MRSHVVCSQVYRGKKGTIVLCFSQVKSYKMRNRVTPTTSTVIAQFL